MTVGRSMSIKKAKDIVEHIHSVVGDWNTYAEQVRVEPKKMEAIASTLIRFN